MSGEDAQLSLSALWSAEGPVPELRLDAPPKRGDEVDLLDGPHVLRGDLERALDLLDAARAEATLRTLEARFGLPAWAAEAHGALTFVHRLEPLDARGQLDLARADDAAEGPLLRRARLAALRRALRNVLEQEGAAAELPEGAAVAALAHRLGEPRLATELLRTACEAAPLRLHWWVQLASTADRAEVAVRGWCHALLLDPERQDEALLRCEPAARLIDEADALELEHPTQWLPVLADLTRLVPLTDLVFELPETHEVQRFARALRRYRLERASLTDAERLERKRALLRARPELKELVRSL